MYIKDELLDYIVVIVYDICNNGDFFLGVLFWALFVIMKMVKVIVVMCGWDFVILDDI